MLKFVIDPEKTGWSYNKTVFLHVLKFVMWTMEKNRNDDKLGYRNRTNFSDIARGSKLNNNQQFVVPWQMQKKEERKFEVKQF